MILYHSRKIITIIETEIPDIAHQSLHEITREFGEPGLLERLDHEIESTDWDDETKQLVYRALDKALSAHEGVTRGNHPYSTHFLRVAIRILSPDHLGIRDRPDLVIAALLHDTVEDHPEAYLSADELRPDKVANQGLALARIAQEYGNDVANHVAAVTNPEFAGGLSKSQKNALYREHVIELLASNPQASIIKLSDFIDNCVGLLHSESTAKAKSMADKYVDLIPYMITFVQTTDLLAPHVSARTVTQLIKAEERCRALLEI